MTAGIGINGFGRMGRLGFRAAWGADGLAFTRVNEIAGDAACSAHLLKFDPPVHDLPNQEFLEHVHSQYNAIPDMLWRNAELRELVLPTLRADFAMLDHYQYRPEPPLACPITALGGQNDAVVDPESLAAWSEHTTGEFVRRIFPGDHFFFKTAEPMIFDLLTEQLKRR